MGPISGILAATGILVTKRGGGRGYKKSVKKKISVPQIEINLQRHRIVTYMLEKHIGTRITTNHTKKITGWCWEAIKQATLSKDFNCNRF